MNGNPTIIPLARRAADPSVPIGGRDAQEPMRPFPTRPHSPLRAPLLAAVAVTASLLGSTALAPAAAHGEVRQTWAWGYNQTGALGGTPAKVSRLTLTPIAGLTGAEVTALAAGGANSESAFGLALIGNGHGRVLGRQQQVPARQRRHRELQHPRHGGRSG